MKKRIVVAFLSLVCLFFLFLHQHNGFRKPHETTAGRPFAIFSRDSGKAGQPPDESAEPRKTFPDPALFPYLEKHPDYPPGKPYIPLPGFKENPGSEEN